MQRLKFIHHNLILFSFVAFFAGSLLTLFSSRTMALELIDQAFQPAKQQNTIIDLWDTKDAVGNEVFRESVGAQQNLWQWCFVQWSRMTKSQLDTQAEGYWISLSDTASSTPNTQTYQDFCSSVLWGDWNVSALESRAPLIVRITKFLLRLVIVLSISMAIYSGLMYIIEASKWAEVKNARDNLLYVVGGVLLALLSLALVNLISSLTISSLTV